MEEITNLETVLNNYVSLIESNGIRQHTKEWIDAKKGTISGSILSTLQGTNPYSSEFSLLGEKIGLSHRDSDIKMQWGNLFESVLKKYVEMDRKCKIVGSDLFIYGPPGTSYSPDGLAIVNNKIALIELKCPQTRIPDKSPPKYYIPQVKMGLDIIDIATEGLFIEGVFRRCKLSSLGFNSEYDTTLAEKTTSDMPIAYGFIGMYATTHTSDLLMLSEECKDLGTCSKDLAVRVFEAYNAGSLQPWYSEFITPSIDGKIDLPAYREFIINNNYLSVGILPWKLFSVHYHTIPKESGYLLPWMQKINDFNIIVNKCNEPENLSIKLNLYNSYVSKCMGKDMFY